MSWGTAVCHWDALWSYTKTLDAVVWVAAVLAYGVRWTISRRMAFTADNEVMFIVLFPPAIKDQGQDAEQPYCFRGTGLLGLHSSFNTEEAFLGVQVNIEQVLLVVTFFVIRGHEFQGAVCAFRVAKSPLMLMYEARSKCLAAWRREILCVEEVAHGAVGERVAAVGHAGVHIVGRGEGRGLGNVGQVQVDCKDGRISMTIVLVASVVEPAVSVDNSLLPVWV